METVLDDALAVAIEAIERAGRLTRRRFNAEFLAEAKGPNGDVVTDVDHLAEAVIVDALKAHFPDHNVNSEERGAIDCGSDWCWVIDPLDGTNNFVLGIAMYGISIALRHRGQTMLGVIHDSNMADTRWAVRGRGSWHGDRPQSVQPLGPPRITTVSWIQGHAVSKRDERSRACRNGLSDRYKRMIINWAPTVDWAALVSGRLGAVVGYWDGASTGSPRDTHDLYAGALLAGEAGAVATDFAGAAVEMDDDPPEFVVAHPDCIPDVIEALAAAPTATEPPPDWR